MPEKMAEIARPNGMQTEIWREDNGDWGARDKGDPPDGSRDRVCDRDNTVFTVKDREMGRC